VESSSRLFGTIKLAIFLTLAVGFFIGKLRIGSFTLGTVVGTLLAGVLIGQLDIEVPALVKTLFFDLFLFTTGHKVGPQFFRGLRKDALPQLAITAVLCVTCLLSAFTAARLLYLIGTGFPDRRQEGRHAGEELSVLPQRGHAEEGHLQAGVAERPRQVSAERHADPTAEGS